MSAARTMIDLIGCVVVAAVGWGCEAGNLGSSSMSPTIAPGEKVTVDYSAYAISQPKRWDVVAFEPPGGSNQTWVFRVVAMPGERVDFASNGIAVNGRPLTLPLEITNVTYLSLDVMGQRSMVPSPYLVPMSSYFLLGDNSRNANDSRFLGAIPKTNIVGRVRGK